MSREAIVGGLPGDVLIQHDGDPPFNPHDLDNGARESHMMIYDGDCIVHSTSGGYQRGIPGAKRHRVSSKQVGCPMLVLRFKGAEFGAALSRIANVFALTPEQRVTSKLKRYPTFYSKPNDRKLIELDEADAPMAYALLRARRTLLKANQGECGVALSFNKGLSCSQFVMYCLQATVLECNEDVLLPRLSRRSQEFLISVDAVIKSRIENPRSQKLKRFLYHHADEVSLLNADLEALVEHEDYLAVFCFNPKGSNVLEVVNFLTSAEGLLEKRVLQISEEGLPKVTDMTEALRIPSHVYDPNVAIDEGLDLGALEVVHLR